MVKQKLIRRKKLRAFVQSSFVSDNAYDEHQKGLGDIFQRLIRFVCEPFFQINNLSEEDRLRIQQSAWHTAVDPDSKRTYYYNLETYETQWEKVCTLQLMPAFIWKKMKYGSSTLPSFSSIHSTVFFFWNLANFAANGSRQWYGIFANDRA